MASIYKRKNSNGTTVWRAIVRKKGYHSVCNHFERKQEAEDWAQNVERQIRLGQFKLHQHLQVHTVLFKLVLWSITVLPKTLFAI